MTPGVRQDDHILVVEDEPAVRQVMQWALEAEGYRVDTAGDEHEALYKAGEREPSLVLLDLQLPRVDAATLAEDLRRRFGDLPIVLTTVEDVAADDAPRAWAVEHLTKPFHRRELIGAVQRGLARTDLRKEA